MRAPQSLPAVAMRYEGSIYRPPSEAGSYILQATIGCSWNKCTYCAMYRDKRYRERATADTLADVAAAGARFGRSVQKVFVADGDALALPMDRWRTILDACQRTFSGLRRVSCYATARNLLAKTPDELAELRTRGLSLLYIGPESGDDVTLHALAKGGTADEHIAAARRAHAAGMKLSAIFLLGAGGRERSQEHAWASAALATAMDPRFLSALTLTVIPGTPLARAEEKGLFVLPDKGAMLRELRTLVAEAAPTDAVFRTNHASNYLPVEGRLPRDREAIVAVIDAALAGEVPLRPEWQRGL